MPKPRVLVVDDESDTRELLVAGLRRRGYAAEAAVDGNAAAARLDEGWAAVVTDLVMPGIDGLRLLELVGERLPGTICVIITSFGDKEHVLAALNRGADYLIEKPFSAQQLAEVLDRLLAEHHDDNRTIDQLFQRRIAALKLTPREREIAVYVLKGMPNKDISRNLEIGEQTVRNALGVIYAKLGVSSRTELFHLVFPI